MVFSKRTMSFIAGGLLSVAAVLYIIANALPMWSKLHIGSSALADIAKQAANLGIELSETQLAQLQNINSFTITLGLWQVCASIDTLSQCSSLPTGVFPFAQNAQMLSARSFITIACILSGFAAICVIACLLVKEDLNGILARLAKILPFVALVGGIIGVATGINFTILNNLVRINVASILGIIALVFNLVGAVVVLLIK